VYNLSLSGIPGNASVFTVLKSETVDTSVQIGKKNVRLNFSAG